MTPQVIPLDRSLYPATYRPPLAAPRICVHDGKRSSFAELGLITLPEATIRESSGNVSYQPLGYQEFFGCIMDVYSAALDAECQSFDAVARADGQQVFAQMTWRNPDGGPTGLSVIAKSSYDFSIANTIANGTSVFVCANGIFNGQNMLKAKHTMNVGSTVLAMVEEQANQVMAVAREMAERLARYAGVQVTPDLFYAMVGVMTGHGLITSTMGNTARDYWNRCHLRGPDGSPTSKTLCAEHGQSDLASALQALTGSLHRAHPRNVLKKHNSVTSVLDGVADGKLLGDPALTDRALQFTIPEFIEA